MSRMIKIIKGVKIPFNEDESENLIKRTANLMVSEGYLAAGYQYITIDDCWLENSRDPGGRLVADRTRFSGMKALSDYLVVGNSGLSVDPAQVQMAVWAVLAAPMMSVDLAEIQPEFKQIQLNRDVIAVSQDKMGKQGLRVFKKGRISLEIWHRELSGGGRALAFVNTKKHSVTVTYTHGEMKLSQLDYIIQGFLKWCEVL